LPKPNLRGHDFNKLTCFVLCQKAFMQVLEKIFDIFFLVYKHVSRQFPLL
jgi:hypothetical protein